MVSPLIYYFVECRSLDDLSVTRMSLFIYADNNFQLHIRALGSGGRWHASVRQTVLYSVSQRQTVISVWKPLFIGPSRCSSFTSKSSSTSRYMYQDVLVFVAEVQMEAGEPIFRTHIRKGLLESMTFVPAPNPTGFLRWVHYFQQFVIVVSIYIFTHNRFVITWNLVTTSVTMMCSCVSYKSGITII
jgi:hypothetical protein